MNKKWMNFLDLSEILKSRISHAPSLWKAVFLYGKRSYRVVPGAGIVVTGFSLLFFSGQDPEIGRDFSWLIKSQLGDQKIRDIIGDIAKPGWSLRHPVIAHEEEWVCRLIELDPTSEVYARYEGADVLCFSV
jgi:hypothetical protein